MAGRMGWASSMVGRTLEGQYRIDGILGEGAMGVVFRGVNLSMDKAVAIKMMRKETFDTPDAVERFKREARVWSQLNHPAITQVFDFGIQDGMLFLVMELVDGLDLSDVLKQEGALKPLRAITLMRQLAAALEEAKLLALAYMLARRHVDHARRHLGHADEHATHGARSGSSQAMVMMARAAMAAP